MTSTSTETFITRMKLRELRAQRDQLRASYAALATQDAAAPDDAARIPRLYEGLRALSFAGRPFHPDAANLDALLHDLQAGYATEETVDFWRARLRRELAQGQLRADTVLLFGALLEEWAEHRSWLPASAAQEDMTRALLERALLPDGAPRWAPLGDALFEALGYRADDGTARLAERVETVVGARVEPDEVRAVLAQLRADPARAGELRAEAARVLDSDLLLHEFADALTILVAQRASWDWPADGVPARARWSRTKWRLFLDDDLPTACLLDVLGGRWRQIVQERMGDATERHAERLRRLRELRAPQVLAAREQELLAALGSPRDETAHDIWAEPDGAADREERHPGRQTGSVLGQRTRALRALRDAWERERYGSEPYGGVMADAVALINAEIALGRAAFPERPLYIVKLDFQDYYPSLPHELLLDILRRMGIAEDELAFFRTYLAVPMSAGGEARPARRGLPNKRSLSDTLGELVLRLLDVHLRRSARVLVVRVMDDICLLATSADEAVRAWEAAAAFAGACGLTLNAAKCGAACLGGETPEALPRGPVTWQMLELSPEGQWRVHRPALDTFLTQARWRLTQASAVLSLREIYNQQLTTLAGQLALTAPLGASHRTSVSAALARYHAEVLGEGQGTTRALQELLRERFLEPGVDVTVPEAWLVWPITAGGLGLTHATLMAQPYAAGLARRPMPQPPSTRERDWQRQPNAWAAFYAAHLAEVEPLTPVELPVMEAMVADFIARGDELRGAPQEGLSTYWRWMLYTYGPQILERLGTFRFLETTLVPQQLIVHRQLGDTEATTLLTHAPG